MPKSSEITRFTFTATIRNSDDSLTNDGEYGVQYFDTNSDKWETIVEPESVTEGAFNVLLDTENPPHPVATATASFVSAVQAGGFPLVRLNREPNGNLPEVLIEGAKVTKQANVGEGNVNFEEVWLLSDHIAKKIGDGSQPELDYLLVGIVRPANDNQFFKAMKAAIQQADLVNQYSDDQIDSFFISLSDGSFVDMVGQISTLSEEKATLEATVSNQSAMIAEKDAEIADKSNEIVTYLADIALKDAKIVEQDDEIASKDAAITTKDEEIVGYQAAVADRDKTISNQKGDIETCSNEIILKEAEIVKRDAIIAERDAKINSQECTITAGETEVKTQAATIETQAADIKTKAAEIETQKAQLEKQEQTIAHQGDEIQKQASTITKLSSEVEARTAEVAARDKTIAVQVEQIAVKDKEITALESEKGELEVQVSSLQAPALPVKDVYSTVVNEFDRASQDFDTSRFAISGLSLDLKTTMVQTPEGEIRLQLLDQFIAEKIKEGTVSTIAFNIDQGTGSTAVGPGQVPSLTGLTESAVRFKLNNLGLKLEAIYHPVTDSDRKTIGQSFKQSPAAGEEIPAEGTVTVIFAKEQETQNS